MFLVFLMYDVASCRLALEGLEGLSAALEVGVLEELHEGQTHRMHEG